MYLRPIAIDEEALIGHVEKICDSPEFRSKQVLCRLLSYLISETLAGRGDDIKAFTIGVDVFKKNEDFDPDQDTLVRINAGRLRRTLDLYYNNTGIDDELRIEIPKGSYIPKVISRSLTSNDLANASSSPEEGRMTLEPSIAVFSFRDLSEDPKNAYFARGFSYELLVELTHFEDLEVYNYLTLNQHPETGTRLHTTMLEKGIRFTLVGAVHGDKDRVNVLVDLRDLHQEKQIWSARYSEKINADNFIEIQEIIVQDISRKLGSEYGIILSRLSLDDMSQKPRKLSTYLAVLKYYNYLVQNTPESINEAFEALNNAVENDPQSGMALSSLAAMHGTAYALDYPDADQSFTAAGELAERAFILEPHNLFVQLSLAFKCFLYDERERFFQIADRMLERNPKSTLRLGALGFYLCLYGDWKRGKQILDSLITGHMDYPRFFHGATAVFYYKDQSYDAALQEAKMYRVPGFFWGPLLRAMVLGQLSGTEEAKTETRQLLQMRPDFENKAHYLISRFVKDDSIVEHMIEGLQKAGLSIL